MAKSHYLCFLLAVCSFPPSLFAQDESPELVLLLTEGHSFFYPGQIYNVQLHHKNYTRLALKNIVTPSAIDYDEVNKRVYWTDISKEQVRSADLDGENDEVIASLNNVSYPDGLAVDDEAGKVFYTDYGNKVIVSIEISGLIRKTIVSENMTKPWGIVADKKKKMLYWVDFEDDTMESCDYDGEGRRIITNDTYAPTGIALNQDSGRLYWCGYYGEVRSVLSSGTDIQDLIARKSPVRRFLDIALYNGLLYITDLTNSRIIIIPESGGEETSITSRYFENIYGIHVFSPNSFETGCADGRYGVNCTGICGKCRVDTTCEKTVGVCLGGCDLGYQGPMCKDVCDDGYYGYRCLKKCGNCKTGTTCNHVTGDCPSGCESPWTGPDCKEKAVGPELVLLLTERHSYFYRGIIYKVKLHHLNFTTIALRDVITPVAIDYDPVNKRIYWTDISQEQVRSAELDGDKDQVVASLNNISYPEGIAVDGSAGKVFFTDRGNKVIVRVEMNGFAKTTIVSTDLIAPWGIAADKKNKKLYWVDYRKNTIESCDYNGNNRRTVLSTGVSSPRGIAINENTGRLYWCEYNGEVNSVLTDGSDKKLLITQRSRTRRFMDISLYNGFLYLSDYTNSNITVIPEDGGTEMRLSSSSFGNINGIHVFSPNSIETGCGVGKYGVGCKSSCGKCSSDTTCEKTVGICLAGCAPGYMGEMCTDTCPSGSFGKRCKSDCGHCAGGAACNRETGNCPSGCEKGWRGVQCLAEECKPGNFAHKTICLPCGECKGKDVCNSDTGACPNGCNTGWNGTNCVTPCKAGTYGDMCAMTCGACYGGIACNPTSGVCPYGCRAGYTGSVCKEKTACGVGTYGVFCTPCGRCLGGTQCNEITGSCPGGCQPNWEGVRCDIAAKTCHTGYYNPPNCDVKCGQCKTGDTCDPVSGHCPNGCKAGWRTNFCNQGCQLNRYGVNCTKECGYCKIGDVCDPATGLCPHGCIEGFTDSRCQTKTVSPHKQTSAAGIVRRLGVDALGIVMMLTLFLLG